MSLATPRAPLGGVDARVPIAPPEYPTVVETVVGQAAAAPDAAAIEQGPRVTTYAALVASAGEVRRALLGTGLEPGAVVAVGGRGRSPGLIAAMLGTLAARGVLLMIDAEFPGDRAALLAQRARARHVLWVGRRGLPAWARAMPHTIVPAECENASVDDAIADARGWSGAAGRRDPAYIFFTSGSTGAPKGVLGAHHGLAHFIAWQRAAFGASPSDRCAALTRVSFDVMLRDVFLPITSGACLLLPGPMDEQPDRVLPWLRSTRATWVHVVPSLASLWMEATAPDVIVPRLRATFFAGERLADAVVRRWRHVAPASAIMNLYGPTETTLAKCCAVIGGEPEPGVQPVGTPLPFTEILILDERGERCSAGVVGEIAIRTPFRTLGYVEATSSAADSARFQVNPITGDPEDVLYLTGDLGMLRPDGQLEVRGRADDQIKLHGVRIEPGEIERMLISVCELRDAVVALAAGPDGRPRLTAYVVPGARTPTPASMRAALAERLPRAMVPSAYAYIAAVPLNANGKRDRRAVPGMASDAAPAEGRRAATTTATAEGTSESRVVDVWRAALARPELDLDDDVFAHGATSVIALAVAARLGVEFRRDVPVGAILNRPTPRGQAAWLREVDDYLARHAEGAGIRYCPHRPSLAFAFPPLLGYGLAFAELASHLTRHAVHAFDLPEADDPVARLAGAVRAIDPHGPYTFLGYSAGGNLAFDVAVALERDGARVDRVVMLDAERRERPDALSDAEIDEIVWGNIENLAGLMRETEQFRDFARNEFLMDRMSQKMRAFLRYESATANLGRTNADVAFVHSTDREPCVRWRESTTGAFTVHAGSGGHLEMTLPPHAERNGRLLDQILHPSHQESAS
ncbi:MAG TPA: AMP-binding protein [Gemmatimonadaceae bacterium]|nr:AMP-binding protein [Gemmatimonadaceae bacterium]